MAMRDGFQIHLSGVIKKQPKARKCHKTELVVIRVNDQVWRKALQLSSGDIRRIQVVSSEEVIVHNRRR